MPSTRGSPSSWARRRPRPWDPVAGCVDPAAADARARALVHGGGGATGNRSADWAPPPGHGTTTRESLRACPDGG
jgi:hypothetical protein